MSRGISDLYRPQRPGEYLATDQLTGQLCWNTDLVQDFWGRWVHKDLIQEPSGLEYLPPLGGEENFTPIGGAVTQITSGTSYTLSPYKFFIDRRTTRPTVWQNRYDSGQYTQATSAEVVSLMPVVNDQIFNFSLVNANQASAVGTVTATDPSGEGNTWSIDTLPHDGWFIDPSTGTLYITIPGLLAPLESYELTIRATTNYPGGLFDTATITVNMISAPVITSETVFSIDENTTAITTCTATDEDDSDTQTWTIDGGPDAALFTINSSSGVLAFSANKNYESPVDSNLDNVYQCVVKVTDSYGAYDTETIVVTINDVEETPVITSASTANVAENTTAVITCTATGPATITWSISGGTDSAFFSINSSSGALIFLSAPDYETPLDSGANNTYVVTVKATHTDGQFATQTITATVTDVNEWDPSSFGTVVAEWDAKEYTTDITVTGLGVSQWLDRSGNNHTLVQTTDADRPAFSTSTGVRLQPGVTFDRSNSEFLVSSEVAATWNFLHNDSAHTITIVYEQQDVSTNLAHCGIISTSAATLSGQGIIIKYQPNTGIPTKRLAMLNNGTTDETPYTTSNMAFTNSRSMVATFAWEKDIGISTDLDVYFDGSLDGSGNISRTVSGSDATSTLCIGTLASDTASRNNNMIVHYISIHSGKMDNTTQLAWYNAIIARFGVGGLT